MTGPLTRAFSFTLYDVLQRNARAFSARTAVVDENGESHTFAQLLERVDRLSAGLDHLGLTHGHRLAILAQNSASFLELYFACARVGAVAYPLNWRWKPEEIGALLERAKPRGVVVDAACRDSLPFGPGDAADSTTIWLDMADDDTTPDGFSSVRSLYDHEPLGRDSPTGSQDGAAIIATAAVEAIPRGAVLTHENLVCANVMEIAQLGLGPSDATLVALPLFHIAGLGHCLAFLHAGGKAVIMPKFDAAAAVAAIDQHEVTHLSDFPPVLSQVLDAAQEADSKLPTLRHVTGLDSPETMARLHDETSADFWTGFGQTETSGFVTLQRMRDRPGASGQVGELCLVDLFDDYDRPVEVGQPGEIVVRGPLVFQGYADEPEVTEWTFRAGWHHTGDVGRFDEDGYLWYVKRKPEKELIKPGGENVYPAEVEKVLVELPEVTAACVFGVPHPKWGEGIKAILEVPEGHSLDAPGVIEFVGSRIARFKKPHFVEFTAPPGARRRRQPRPRRNQAGLQLILTIEVGAETATWYRGRGAP